MPHIPILWIWLTDRIGEISELSNYDFICLVASFNNMTDDHKVSPELACRGYTSEMIAATKKIYADTFKPFVSCGLRFTQPLDDLKFEPFGYVLKLHTNYERGNLPFPGSVSEQPAQILELFSVLDNLKLEQEQKRQKKSDGRHFNQNYSRPSR